MFDTNWRSLMLRSYTVWAFYTLALLSLLPDTIYLLTEIDTDPAIWTALQIWVAILGIVGRMVLQTRGSAYLRGPVVFFIVLLTLALASQAGAQTTERQTMRILVPLVERWEGEHRCADDRSMHCAYLDIVGVPTICAGETSGVHLGMRATDVECRAMLIARLTDDFRAGLHRYFSDETKAKRLTPYRDAAYTSLAYNVGIRGAGRSTATRRLNAGDIRGGCKAIGWWNKAGGRVVRGLVNRRTEEVGLCLRGLP